MKLFLFITLAGVGAAVGAVMPDPVGDALTRCLNGPGGISTGGQSDCQTIARHAYDRRMNTAYALLMTRLPADARQRLRLSQRAWLAFRDMDAQARDAFYAARKGSMYVPMQAGAETTVTRDRALQLETWVRIATIDR